MTKTRERSRQLSAAKRDVLEAAIEQQRRMIAISIVEDIMVSQGFIDRLTLEAIMEARWA